MIHTKKDVRDEEHEGGERVVIPDAEALEAFERGITTPRGKGRVYARSPCPPPTREHWTS